MYQISSTFPSPIVRDFLTYINYCEQHHPKVTKTNEFISRKDVHELNKMMKQKTDGVTSRNDQQHYPILHLFYHLSLQGDLFFIEREKTKSHFSPNQEKLEYFRQLNFTQQYFYLFKTLFIYCDWENIQSQERAHINHNGTLDVFEWCSAHHPNEIVSFNQQVTGRNSNLSWTASGLGIIMIYLEFFGFWKCKISDHYRTKTHLIAESILISEFGIKMCECIVRSGGYTKWNIYYRNELDGDFIEAFMQMQNLIDSGKTQEEAEQIVSKKYDNQQEEMEKIISKDFENLFQDMFSKDELGKIIIKEPHELKDGIYTFKTNLTHDPKTIRRIQLDAKHTLYDLHLMIQSAYGFEDDHLYSFYMDGKQYSKLRYNDPRGEEPPFADEVELGELEFLSINKKILYLFDYGDSWWFDIILEKIEENQVLKGNGKIIESIGESPEQYPNYEEDDW